MCNEVGVDGVGFLGLIAMEIWSEKYVNNKMCSSYRLEDEDAEEEISEDEFDDAKTFATMGEVVTEEDERALNAFLNPASSTQQKTLTDVILEKLQQKTEGLLVADR